MEDAATYRHRLEVLFERNGVSADFVGDVCRNCNQSSAEVHDHRCDMGCKRGPAKDKFIAFWGWLSGQILSGNGPSFSRMDDRDGQGLSTLIHDLSFNVAIIHLGTNDIGHRLSAAQIADNIGGIIDVLRNKNPKAAILVSKIIPISSRWNVNDAVQDLNKYLEDIAPKWNSTESPVLLVDCYSGFDLNKHTVDRVHPNKGGAALMAHRFYEAVMSLGICAPAPADGA